ncbi:Fur family transcriptional regulator [Labrenzia sp. 011]|uniref:Fur family transcriptional regulator n=1 Tax=Labrenzia sp. 011 TaxID=2171494 RepID=UPI000D51B953|nr:Fur family transcriptional regulator [Labrenzia sp. 011]PVB63374.1 transcriptional repressor [Labrenzia sp. 011]
MSAHAHHELTKNQALVFQSLSDAGGPLTAYAILDLLRDNGFRAPLQVYRALDKLVEFGMVHRLESLNAFVACSHKDCAGGHGAAAFAICEKCGDVREFTPDEAMSSLKKWTESEGFILDRTTIELRGTCKNCITAN